MKIFLSYPFMDSHFANKIIARMSALKADLEFVSIYDIETGSNIRFELNSRLNSADVFIAFVSSGSKEVFYELGIASGIGKPLVIASFELSSIPSSLYATPFVSLSGNETDDAVALLNIIENLEPPEHTNEISYNSAEQLLIAGTRDRKIIDSLNPQEFEKLIEELFVDRGIEVEKSNQVCSDMFDFLVRDKGANQSVIVELKKLNAQSKVSAETVLSVFNSVTTIGAAVGVIVATSGFTSAAISLAARLPVVLKTLDDVLSSTGINDLIREKHNKD